MGAEPERYAAMFDRYYREIYAFAARRLGRDLAEDVASETFLVAYDRRDRFDPTRPDARAWLYGIAVNLIARHHRAEQRRYRAYARSAGDPESDSPIDAVADRLDAATARGLLARGLAGLSTADREVLLLVGWGGLSCQEAATALDIPAGTARSRLHRARRHMRAVLGIAEPAPYLEEAK